jgi:selenocysteine lyase/cysteine desulfurase
LSTPLPREEFGVTERYVYLNHAAVGVLPKSSAAALETFVLAQAGAGVLGTWAYEDRMPQIRAAIARFIGGRQNEIAVVRNSSDGANAIACGIDWQPGDEAILCDNEFPANAIPWVALRRRGVNVRVLSTARERLTETVLAREISPRTKVVTVSWVSYGDGYRHDLRALAEVAHRHGALLCVDGMQAVGAFPIDVRAEGVDALYLGAAKWMLSLQGVGFLYMREGLIDTLTLAAPGWRSMRDMWDFENYGQPYIADASRFEGGTPSFLGALSIESAIALIERCGGAGAIAAHVLGLTDRLCDGLQRLGATIASLRGETTSSGIVTFSLPGADGVELGRALQAKGIVTTHRASGIRVAPHGYNTTEEIDRLLEAVAQYAPTAAEKA